METTIVIKQKDSSGYTLRAVSLVEQTKVNELVELFLDADLKTQEKILTKLRK
jgi:hypothetical protein